MYSEVEMKDFLFPECEIKKTLDQKEDICFDDILREIFEVDFNEWEKNVLSITQGELDSVLDPVEHQTEEFKNDVVLKQSIQDPAFEEELGPWNFSDHDGLDYDTIRCSLAEIFIQKACPVGLNMIPKTMLFTGTRSTLDTIIYMTKIYIYSFMIILLFLKHIHSDL